MRFARVLLIGIASLVALAVIAAAIFVATFSADHYKPRIVAAVKAATGRDVALNGPIGLTFSLHPTIEAQDVTLDNPPGFSRPQMATIQAIDLQLALLPLIHRRVEIDRLVLVKPDILLERTAQGAVNWTLTPPPRPAAPVTAPQAEAQARQTRAFVALRDVRVENGRLAYRDDRTGHIAAVEIRQLSAKEDSSEAPLHLTADAVVNGLPFTLSADTGSLASLQTGEQPWPVKGTVTAAGATAHAEGQIAQPLAGRGYALSLAATVPDLAVLAPFAPNAKLPPLHDVSFSAKVADSGGPIPNVTDLVLHAGVSDLSSVTAGLKLDKLDVSAPALDQPAHIQAAGSYAGMPVTLVANPGTPMALLHGGPLPVDVSATVAGGTAQVKGTIADPARMDGANLAIDAKFPDLAALSPLAGRPLPLLKEVAFQGRFTDPQGLAKGASLQGFKLTSAQGDLAGDGSVAFGQPMSLQAKVASNRIDLDAVQAAFRPAAPPASPVPAPPVKAAPPPASHPAHARLFSDKPIPFGVLRLANADVQLAVGTLVTGGQQWREIAAHLVLQDGQLRLDPFKATLPAGALTGAASVDARQPAPPVALRLQAPSVALKSLLTALGEPAYASGAIAIAADLHGAGDTPHAIAAGLDGTLSLAMQGGEIDTGLLERALGPVIARANPAAILGRTGATQIRCFAARFTIRQGTAALNPLLLSSSLITVSGTGSLNLAQETLDLHLQTQGRIGGTSVSIPLTVIGGFADPKVVMNQSGVAQRGFEAVIGALGGKNNPLADVLGAGAPSCVNALAESRGGAAPAPAHAAPAPKQKLPNAGAVLRQLLR